MGSQRIGPQKMQHVLTCPETKKGRPARAPFCKPVCKALFEHKGQVIPVQGDDRLIGAQGVHRHTIPIPIGGPG
jgi:hypothetical protein